MSLRLVLFASALGASMLAVGGAAYVVRASDHANLEPSVSAACFGCHARDYRSARHHVGVKPTTCGACHRQSAWRPTALQHPFALTGAHEKAKCFDCHRGEPPRFHGTSSVCVDCHHDEYERAPHHVERQWTTCEECHSFVAWKPPLPRPVAPEPIATTPPPPPPSATASAPPKPKPHPTVRPHPTVKPVPSTPPLLLPDVVTHPS